MLAVIYYVKKKKKLQEFVEQLNENEAVCIREFKKNLQNNELKVEFMKNMSKLTKLQPELKVTKITAEEAMRYLNEMKVKFEGPIAEKYEFIIRENVGLKELLSPDPEKYTASEILALKRAPINSAAVERSFSKYKTY